MDNDEGVQRHVPLGDFRRIILQEAYRLLTSAKLAKELARGADFVRREATTLIRHMTLEELLQSIVTMWAASARDFPELKDLFARSTMLAAEAVSAPDISRLLGLYEQLMNMHRIQADKAGARFSLEPGEDALKLVASSTGDDPDGIPSWALASDHDDQAFLAAVANTLAQARRDGRPLTRNELAAASQGYRLLDRGVQLPPAYRSIGVYGFRQHQTSLSVANPGEGHLSVTCAHQELLDGTIVHVEHIDRDGVDDREVIEPYRLPATVNAARVRLHAGNIAPCTAYIGRPVFENGVVKRSDSLLGPVAFERDLLKTAHGVASACTAMFMNGVADCKIAIERMSYTEAVQFMRAVVGNVVRDPTRQYLSAAFNINLPLWDDRLAPARSVTERMVIAKLGLEIAVSGRFDKVTWDGATNEVPSRPVIEQLSRSEWVELVHEAHEQGLETYVSAGMNASHMPACVFTGVDAVGIGTSLHFRHPVTKAIGQLRPDAIREVLSERNAAAAQPLGRAARLLANLDRRFFEGSLPTRLEKLRKELFVALRDGKPKTCEKLLPLIELPKEDSPDKHPLVAQAERLLAADKDQTVGQERMGTDRWNARLQMTRHALNTGDITDLMEVLA